MPALNGFLLPPEIAEIAASAAKPLSSKKRRKLQKSTPTDKTQHGEYLLDTRSDMVATGQTGHREKLAPVGNQLDPLIARCSLVAKPIPRKLWASMPKAQAAIDAERRELRECDGGRGTWDESTVTNYWDAQRQAKEKLERTGVHTHFGSVVDLCVGKASELEESERRYKGRVVFGGIPHSRRILISSRVS